MNILYLNGSPRKQASATKKLADAFVEGMLKTVPESIIDEITLYEKAIAPCRGCFGCWHATPGTCVIRDDMDSLLPLFRRAHVVVWSMPLYYFGMPSTMKAFLDRLMPNNSPLFEKRKGGVRHPQRYDAAAQRHVLVSTCGFQESERNFEAIALQFDLLCDDRVSKILCPAGGAFATDHLGSAARKRLEEVQNVGADYTVSGTIARDTERALSIPVYDPDRYMAVVNRLAAIAETPAPDWMGARPSPQAHAVLAAFVARYREDPEPERALTIEFAFSDERSQAALLCETSSCTIEPAPDERAAARIEADVALWKRIVSGDTSISDALLNGTLKVWGDFDAVLRLEDLFVGIEV
ncbi:flavodoxin family protein [Raoultibacter phocaeensis]|uniref:flavodoxin family protein n=1 Tax=Raoultibacter phocaeensis TaxID=2479841 RepID=UPI0015D61E25|nr:flavodoxin family protein [Raoultibacter phocaeensis]